ncbi:hypothetical protein E6C70_14710 [Glaciibacter flavus]|uniref:NTP pyrophosphohydrolase n=1 Tax=Orlajensenia flava TaxID=2565934 RepID=A0A4S4FL32_9MICO|nr:hypothetical protein [Glaciibacter flavus]THG30349.1 hypothetical protein E6C70_14990 [Glaciibacter flavus]THG30612.1 hypothetical protein E6C70_14710 [Glaciibacter flavus]
MDAPTDGTSEAATGGGNTAAPGQPLHPGRITVAERALGRVAEVVTAETLGVSRDKLSVTVAAGGGGLALQVRSPLPVPDLDDDAAIHAGGSVIDRLTAAQATIRDRATQIMGRPVVRVNIRIDGAEISERKRVL